MKISQEKVIEKSELILKWFKEEYYKCTDNDTVCKCPQEKFNLSEEDAKELHKRFDEKKRATNAKRTVLQSWRYDTDWNYDYTNI